ncbi:MAG: SO_0444 family Cu/Zn efflux transporter [Thiohalocapsa sp.]|nr:SO_0444 family Cu/Zn efflux transporter [Thiohalocapsa sp.]MCF7989246.1 SO_0444 family Cu/Zn efflux transporter [Thiohalocapsa sp.]
MIELYLNELWRILLELSPSLLLGLFIAGLMYVYLPPDLIRRGLNRPDMRSVARASLFGVPLPLCSCGVIPTALGLRKQGASPGATTAFMISTPQTGVDSILVNAAFLGWPFVAFKVTAAFVSGLVGGALVNRFGDSRTAPERGSEPASDEAAVPAAGCGGNAPSEGRGGLLGAVRYAVFDLLAAIDLWLIAGVLAAALVTTLTPPDYFADRVWSQGLVGMLVVLAISLPLYVCTTASVPIAASLIAAGMPAGSALVFLMAGPATNVATIGAVYRVMGGRVLSLYLGTVVFMSLAFGLLFENVVGTAGGAAVAHEHGAPWWSVLSALVLVALLGWLGWRRVQARRAASAAPPPSGDMLLQVEGMTCQHCVASVKRSLESVAAVDEATPDLASGEVRIRGGRLDASALARVVEEAGFQVKGVEKG